MKTREFDWDQLAFGSKKDLRSLKSIFITAPRDISALRFTQLVKEYLPKGNILLGVAKEDYIDGFEDQPQFRTLQAESIQGVVDKVNSTNSPHKIYLLHYSQRYLKHILEKVKFAHVLLVNGSWQSAFHNRAEYYTLVAQGMPFSIVSAFADEKEANSYNVSMVSQLDKLYSSVPRTGLWSEEQILERANEIASRSYDYCFQTGAVLGKKSGSKYKELLVEWNHVVPYETFALCCGSLREINLSPPGDLNFYDTVHAEVEIIISAQKQKLNLAGTTLFINLLPCPTCARMLCETDIAEIVYQFDHSEGYAVALLEKAGKKVRRVVDKKVL